MAPCGYIAVMAKVGIRKLKNALSRFVRRAEAGERVLVTDRGRVVAALVPAGEAIGGAGASRSRYDELVAAGVLRPALESGPIIRGLPRVKVPKGTAERLINEDRDED